jgi:hypothetical protein
MSDVIYEPLECGRRIGEADGHGEELEVAMVGMKRRLLIVLRMHPYLIVAKLQV